MDFCETACSGRLQMLLFHLEAVVLGPVACVPLALTSSLNSQQ